MEAMKVIKVTNVGDTLSTQQQANHKGDAHSEAESRVEQVEMPSF